MNLREKFILGAGDLALPGFSAKAGSFVSGGGGRLARINALLTLARAYRPAYSEACAAAGIPPEGLSSPVELPRLPLMRRGDLTAGSGGAALARLESGGTGMSGRVETALDLNAVLLRYAALLAVLKETGWTMGQKTAALHPVEYGYFNNLGKMLRSGAYSRIGFEFFQQYVLYGLFHNRKNVYYDSGVFAGGDAAPELLRRAAGEDPVLIITRPDALTAILTEVRRGRPPAFGRLRSVLTVGTVLGEAVRSAAVELLGAKVYNMYASTELGYVALGCACSGGWLHVNEGDYIVETGPEDEIIVTDLNNHLTPLLRYATGDAGLLERKSCACGRAGLMIRPRGRKGRFLETANGGRLYETEVIDRAVSSGLPLFQISTRQKEIRLAVRAERVTGAGTIVEALGLKERSFTLLPGAGFEIPSSGKFSFIV